MEIASGPFRSLEEVQQLIEGLSLADHARLMIWGRYFYVGSGLSPDDLVQETLLAVLAGERQCASRMQIMPFLKSSMRSIAYGERVKLENKLTVQLIEVEGGADEPDDDGASDDTQHAVLVEDALNAVFKACADDTVLETVVLLKGFGSSPLEVQRETGLSPVAYDSTLKRIKRLVQKLYPEGWDL